MAAVGTLAQTLDLLRRRIEKAGSKGLNEQNTKASLIDPLLQALGWDTQDVEEVLREYKERNRDKPVDYALLTLREPRLFVEAKGLGENLSDRAWANQIMGYAAVAGVEWIVLTDGNEYRIYNTHAAVKVDEKLLISVRVSSGETLVAETLGLLSKPELASNRIKALWDAHFIDRQVKAAIERLFSRDEDITLVNHVRKCTKDISTEDIRSSLRRCKVHLDFPVSPDAIAPLAGKAKKGKRMAGEAPANYGVSLHALIQAGALKPPMKLFCTYKGKALTATVMPNGSVECQGKRHDSLSLAASEARASVIGYDDDGHAPPTNGWTFWKHTGPDGQPRQVSQLRQQFLAGSGGSTGQRAKQDAG